MSKKAEERAKEFEDTLGYYQSMSMWPGDAFRKGYEQAEKDMKWEIDHREEAYMQGFKDGTDNAEVLTWKDVQRIVEIADGLLAKESHTEILLAEFQSEESYYQEILKRFNEERK